MSLDVIRRIAERGLKLAQERIEYEHIEYTYANDYLDLFQHILDELERIDG